MSILQRLQDVLGLGEPFDEFEDDPDYQAESLPPNQPTGARAGSTPNNIIEMPGLSNAQNELIVMEPRSFEEVPDAILALRDRKTVILNLGMMEPEQAQRSVDYVAGGVFAIDGHQERVGKNIFLFTPSSVQISNYPVPTATAAYQATSFQRSPVPTTMSYGQSLTDALSVKPKPTQPRFEVKPDIF
ncbi:MAG TPA: cell division protein SepF [Elainellaceae cyanobacterium]